MVFRKTTSVSNPKPSILPTRTTVDRRNRASNAFTLNKSLAEYLSVCRDNATCNTQIPPGFNVRSISATNRSGYSAWSNTFENSKSKVSFPNGWLWKSPWITNGGYGTRSIPIESETPIRFNASTSCPTRAPMQSAFESFEISPSFFNPSKNLENTWIFLSQSRVVHIFRSFGSRVLLSCFLM